MCHPVRCPHCGKITWAGCGLHADRVMKGGAGEPKMHLQ